MVLTTRSHVASSPPNEECSHLPLARVTKIESVLYQGKHGPVEILRSNIISALISFGLAMVFVILLIKETLYDS